MNKSMFTEEQTQYIIDNYEKLSTEEIANKLGFTVSQIRSRANYLGLKKGKTFTEEQEKFITDNYPTINTKEIANKLGTTIEQVNIRANNLGIRKIINEEKYIVIDSKQTKIENITGKKFNKLTVIGFDEKRYKIDIEKYKNKEIKAVLSYWLCKCDCGNSKISSVSRGCLTGGHTTSCGCNKNNTPTWKGEIFKQSFEQWCIEKNHKDYLDLWDYNLNNKLPTEVASSSNKKFYFKCPKGIHKSELKTINYFKRETKVEFCNTCNSFAQWGIDNICSDFLEKYWDYGKNKINPWEIFKAGNIRVWIKCQNINYHDSYEVICSSFYTGSRCPYCANRKIHPNDSLGGYLKNKGLLKLWSEKNNKDVFSVAPKNNNRYWFKCENGIHKDYYRTPNNNIKCNFRCPECSSSKGEQKVADFLIDKDIKYIPQREYDGLIGVNGGNLRFDFSIPSLNINIEYDGIGHYEPVDFDGQGIESAKEKFKILKLHDKFKNEYCKIHNIKLIRIPYWDFDNIEEILVKELKLN